MNRIVTLLTCTLVCALLPGSASAQEAADAATTHLSQFGDGGGPAVMDGVTCVLDHAGTFSQSNAVAFDRGVVGAFESTTLTCRMRVTEGGDGGAFVFLNTGEYGARGPAPFVADWTAPNLRETFAVGIDVHDPENDEPFGDWGNYQGLPEREVSLHWNGREIVKRVADAEFRGDWADVVIDVAHVCGGAEVSVRIGAAQVYDRYFVAELQPYEMRLAVGAGTREDVATEFDVADVSLTHDGAPAAARRRPLHVDVFNHVLSDNAQTSFQTEVDLPPLSWAFGRIILTLDIHDSGRHWDEWDRNGHVFVVGEDGTKWDIAPFITSYRRECHWLVDVTQFRPWLTGKTRLDIAAGTGFYKNRGFMTSVTLDYYHALPESAPMEPMEGAAGSGRELSPYRIEPLWVGSAKYRSAQNHFADFFTPRDVVVPEDAEAARIYTTTTGHSQVGEFTPSDRTIVFVADKEQEGAPAQRFDNTLWKADCYLNPVRPQFGTWKYSRAGWAPGDVVRPWWIDLTPFIVPGRTAELRYEPQPYDFTDAPEDERPDEKQIDQASHVIRSYLIFYRTANDAVPAPILRVTNVAGGSAAAKAGIAEGDYLASYDGTLVDSIDELTAAKKAATDAGKERVAVVVYRGSERLELEMTAGQMGVNLSTP